MTEQISGQRVEVEPEVKLQIDIITDDSLSRLKEIFPDTDKYKLIIRDFSPHIEIGIISILLNQEKTSYTDRSLQGIVTEGFTSVSPLEILFEFRNKGEKDKSYIDEVNFLRSLKNLNFTEEILNEIGSDKQYPEKYCSKFLDWFHNEKSVISFVEKMEGKYPDIFSVFPHENPNDQERMVEHLRLIIGHSLEQKIRSDEITNYVKKNYEKYTSFFGNEIKAQVYAVFDWVKNKSEKWYREVLCGRYMKSLDYSKLPRGIREAVVSEIVPEGLETYAGEIGGKTIKIVRANALNAEFIRAQLFETPECVNAQNTEFEKMIRDFFLKTKLARRYITVDFGQGEGIIDEILESEEKAIQKSKPYYKISDDLRNNPEFRKNKYISAYLSAIELVGMLHKAYGLDKR